MTGMELFWCRKYVDLKRLGRYFIVYFGNAIFMATGVFICIKTIPDLWSGTFIAVGLGVFIYGLLLLLEKNHFALDFISAVKRKIAPKRT